MRLTFRPTLKWLALALVLGAGAAGPVARPAAALTLSEIRTQVRRNVRDTAASGNRYSDAILLDWINEAQRETVNMTWCITASTSVSLTANTTFYSMPDNFMAAKMVLFSRTGMATIEVKEALEEALYGNFPDLERTGTGIPTTYFIRQSLTGGDNLQMGFTPVPTSSSVGTARVSYYAYATDLSGDSDVPFGGLLSLVPYHYALVAHVTARIKAIEAKDAEATYYRGEFDRVVGIMGGRLGEAPNYRPGVSSAAKR